MAELLADFADELERLLREHPNDGRATRWRLTLESFKSTLGKPPTADELAGLEPFLKEE